MAAVRAGGGVASADGLRGGGGGAVCGAGGDFIATRNELAKELKAAGDQLGSTRLKALRKPTVAAWLANLVARELPDEIDDLLALGDEFREATADLDGERLRELTPKRHKLLDKLAKSAAELAEARGPEGQRRRRRRNSARRSTPRWSIRPRAKRSARAG